MMKAWKYPLCVIASAIIFGISPTLMKITYAYGGNGLLSTFYTSLFALPLLFLRTKRACLPIQVDRCTFRKLCILGSANCVTALSLYTSYSYIPVGVATTLHFVYPVAIALYLSLFYREKLSRRHLLTLVLAASGIVCLGGDGFSGSGIGNLIALASGFSWGFYIVYMEKSGLKALPASALNFYMMLFNAVASGIACVATGGFAIFRAPIVWVVIVVITVLHRVIAYELFQIGLRNTDSFSTGIFSTFEPIVAVIMGILFLNERLTFSQSAGLALILSGIVANVYVGAERNRI